MDTFEFNNVKAEKAQAIRNYNLQKIFQKLEVFTALALLAWSSYNYTPVAVKISADFVGHNAAVFGQPLYVFIAINMLIVIISVLSFQKPAKQDIYKEYVSITNRSSTTTSATDERQPGPEVTVSDNQIARVDNVVNSPVEAEAVAAIPPEDGEVPKRAVGTVTEVKQYRRTRSERLDRKGSSRGLLTRSETLIKRADQVNEGRRSSEMMDDLSSEEFRMTIETFIASKKKRLIEENTLDLKLENKQSLALTLSTSC